MTVPSQKIANRRPLITQVSQRLISDIRKGILPVGKRLPGDRVLAERFGTSRGTIIEALKLLMEQNYLQRVSHSGTFVTYDGSKEKKTLRLLLPFPEKSISVEAVHSLENWWISSEIQRGIVDECMLQGAEMTFQHFSEAEDEITLSSYIRTSARFDGAIFIGWQLGRLCERMVAHSKRCVQINLPDPLNNRQGCAISYDLKYSMEILLDYLLKQCQYRRLVFINESDEFPVVQTYVRAKHDAISAYLKEKYPNVEFAFCVIDESNEERAGAVLRQYYAPDTCLVNLYTVMMPLIYRMVQQEGLTIGSDVGIVGSGSGIVFTNLNPAATYLHIDFYDLGRNSCRLICESVHDNGTMPDYVELRNSKLIKGESTKT